jgi:hypothetical protein
MTITILSLFISIVLFEKIGLPYHIRGIFNLGFTRKIKILDCLPCFTFWIGMIVLLFFPWQDITQVLAAYLIALFYELLKYGNQ